MADIHTDITKLAINDVHLMMYFRVFASFALVFCFFVYIWWLFMLLTNERRSFGWNHSAFRFKQTSTHCANMLCARNVYHSLVTKNSCSFEWQQLQHYVTYSAVSFYLSRWFIYLICFCYFFHVNINFKQRELQSHLLFLLGCWHFKIS